MLHFVDEKVRFRRIGNLAKITQPRDGRERTRTQILAGPKLVLLTPVTPSPSPSMLWAEANLASSVGSPEILAASITQGSEGSFSPERTKLKVQGPTGLRWGK